MKILGRVPGMNVLASALSVITPQFILYYENTSRITTSIGTLVSQYKDPVIIRGSWQIVTKKIKEQYGLNFNADYGVFYCPEKYIQDVERDRSGDILEYQGSQYQCIETPSDWFASDGWVGMWGIKIPKTALSIENDR